MRNNSEFTLHARGDDGVVQSFGPGDDIPSWVQVDSNHPYLTGDDSESDGDGPDDGGPPPRAGRGSGEKEWRDYASVNGVTVGPAAKRDDIIAAVEAAGVAVE